MRALTMLILPLVQVGVPHAQTPDARDVNLGHFPPILVLDVKPALRLTSETFSLYAAFDRPPPEGGRRFLAARRLTSRPGGDNVEWARISDCPGAEQALLALENLPAPSIDIPTIGREDDQGPPLDGVTYRLWSRWPKWPDGFGYEVSFESNFGTPLEAWAEAFRTTMLGCWTAEPPAAWN